MKFQKINSNLKKIVAPLIGIIAFILYILCIFFFNKSDLSQIIVNFQKVNPIFYTFAILSSLLEVIFFTYSWKILLDSLWVKLPFLRANLYVFYGNFVDTLIPAGSTTSDLTRVYLVTKEQGKTRSGPAMASLIMHRFVGMGMNVIVLTIGAILLATEAGAIKDQYLNSIIIVTVAIAVALIGLIVLLTNDKISTKFVNGIIKFSSKISRDKWNLLNLRNNVKETIQNYHESMKYYRKNPKPLIISFFLMVITWVFSLATQYLVFQSLNVPISIGAIAITAGIVLAASAIPLGIIGIPDVVMISLYTVFTGDLGAATVATLLIRFLTLWLRFILGFAAQQWLELKPMKIPEIEEIPNPSKA